MADPVLTTDAITPPGETTTEWQALQGLVTVLQQSHFWAGLMKAAGLISLVGTFIIGYAVQFASAHPENHTLTAIVGSLAGLLLVSGAILKTSAVNTQTRAVSNFTDSRTTVKAGALDAIEAMFKQPKAAA